MKYGIYRIRKTIMKRSKRTIINDKKLIDIIDSDYEDWVIMARDSIKYFANCYSDTIDESIDNDILSGRDVVMDVHRYKNRCIKILYSIEKIDD